MILRVLQAHTRTHMRINFTYNYADSVAEKAWYRKGVRPSEAIYMCMRASFYVYTAFIHACSPCIHTHTDTYIHTYIHTYNPCMYAENQGKNLVFLTETYKTVHRRTYIQSKHRYIHTYNPCMYAENQKKNLVFLTKTYKTVHKSTYIQSKHTCIYIYMYVCI